MGASAPFSGTEAQRWLVEEKGLSTEIECFSRKALIERPTDDLNLFRGEAKQTIAVVPIIHRLTGIRVDKELDAVVGNCVNRFIATCIRAHFLQEFEVGAGGSVIHLWPPGRASVQIKISHICMGGRPVGFPSVAVSFVLSVMGMTEGKVVADFVEQPLEVVVFALVCGDSFRQGLTEAIRVSMFR